MKFRFSVLDSFRGLAAICVVFYHMHFVGTVTETDFFRGSFIFVDFFFVLSGFVLAHGYGFKTKLDFSAFIKKRFFRLYPLHLVMLMGFLAFEIARLLLTNFFELQFNSQPFSGAQAVAEILPNLLLLQSWLPSANPFSFNAPSWSISVEFYLYILLFLSITLGHHIKRLIWVMAAMAAAYLTVIGTNFVSPEVLRGLLGFFGGAVVYLLVNYVQGSSVFVGAVGKPIRILGSIAEVVTLLLMVWVVSNEPDPSNIGVVALFCVAVMVFSFEFGIVSNLLKHSVFQYLGKVSYSIYLTHSLILLCFNSAVIWLQSLSDNASFTFIKQGERYFDVGSGWINSLFMLLILALVIAISHITYHRIELKWQVKSSS